MHMRSIFLMAFSLLSICASSEAVSIYKYRLADGTTLYSQAPGRRGVLLEVLHIPPATRADIAALKRARQETERAMKRGDYLTTMRKQYAGDNACIPPMAANLQNTPLPGERSGTVGRYSRLSDYYWQRVYGAPLGSNFVLDSPDPSRTEHDRLK